MHNAELLSKLEEIVGQLGLELRWDEGDFTGGICRFGDRKILVMNRSLPTFEKIRVLCQNLSQADLSKIFVLPAIREQIVQRAVSPSE
jgi:hypothetical protein